MHLDCPSGSRRIVVEADQCLVITLEDFKSGERDFDLVVEMKGDNAQCRVVGRVQSTCRDRKSWKISQVYQGKNQEGHIELRGTAEDESFLAFHGGAVLEPSSEDANAQVTEKIMLFDQARGKALPVLTVKTDRVAAAGHGASIAPVSPETLLYFQSKGISSSVAGNMIKEGFLQ